MTIFKAQWDADGDNLRLSMPFSKVDVEKRMVSGFATLDNVDKQADIVTAEASVNAFSRFRGNIREMHQPISVGKMVNFKEEKYFDPETKKFYSGVYVSAYISKGAQDTWEKVLDGTLSGFSIGGKMKKYEDAYDANSDKQIRIIKDYDLHELSLVDNPANQFANIMSIEKVDGVDVLKSDMLNVDIENVFWDEQSGLVVISKEETASSPIDNTPMKNIGFVETNDSEKTEMIKFLVDSAKGIDLSKMNKEVSPMSKATDTVVEKSDDVVEEAQVAPEADAVVEEVAVVEAVAEEAPVVEEVVSDVTAEVAEEAVTEEVSKSEDVASAISQIKDEVTSAFSDLSTVVKSLSEEIAELKKSLATVNDRVTETASNFNEFGKRIDAVEADTAIRKSGDLGEIVQENEPEQVQKSLWGGRFLKTADLFK